MLKQWTPQPQEPVCGAFPQETPKYFRYLSGKRLKQVSWLPAELGAADSWAVQYRIHVLTLPLDYFFSCCFGFHAQTSLCEGEVVWGGVGWREASPLADTAVGSWAGVSLQLFYSSNAAFGLLLVDSADYKERHFTLYFCVMQLWIWKVSLRW